MANNRYFIEVGTGRIILYNRNTNKYVHVNTTNRDNKVIDNDFFKSLDTKEISHNVYNELVNTYSRLVKHKWKYENTDFEKVLSFKEDKHLLSLVPRHTFPKLVAAYDIGIYVYFLHKVYIFVPYEDWSRGHLYCPKTFKALRWARIENLSPIRNINTKKFI